MALEDLTGSGKYIDDLVSANPAVGDDVSEGDDHIRGIKNVLKLTFPSIDGAITATDTELNYVDGVSSAIQTQIDNTVTVANAALPKAGGAMTGAITTNSTFDGVDIATRDGVLTSTTATAAAALPKAGGTMTGHIVHNDDVKSVFGTSSDGLEIFHGSGHSFISDTGSGNLNIKGSAAVKIQSAAGEDMFTANTDGSIELYHNNAKKIETTANGVTVTGGAVGTMTTDNDGSFAMSASNNFKCTPAGNFALTFTAIVAQSGNILFINSGGHTISAHANTKVDANLLATISTAGTYLLSYFSDGTNVYMTNSAIYT